MLRFVFFLLLCAAPAMAVTGTPGSVVPGAVAIDSGFLVAWTYPTTIPGLAGFQVYRDDGTAICGTMDPTARELTCVDKVFPGVRRYYMTAVKTAGVESAHSELFQVDYPAPPKPPAPADVSGAPVTGYRGEPWLNF